MIARGTCDSPRIALVNARVRTMVAGDPAFAAIGAQDGRIQICSGTSEVLEWAGPDAAVYDLRGGCVLPGFTDPHVHLESPSSYDRSLDGCESREQLLERVRTRVEAAADDWVLCSGQVASPDLWPTARELDLISGEHSVALTLGGAIYALNSRALAGVDREAVAESGSVLAQDAGTGEATGVLRTRGADQLQNVLPRAPLTGERAVEGAILTGLEQLARAGVTSVHHVVKERLPIEIYQRLVGTGSLPLRVGLLLRIYESELPLASVLDLGFLQGFGSPMLKLQGLKVSVDGYFPRGGALFSEPYADDPSDCGRARIDQEELDELIDGANRHGHRIAVHANGDRALNMVLSSYERALKAYPRSDHRHRIEHFGNIYLPDDCLSRTAELGVVAVPNPTFMHDRVEHLRVRLGERRGSAPLRVKSMRAAGIEVALGTDFAGLHPPDPLLGIAALVTRRSLVGEEYAPEEAITPLEALTMYTQRNAWLGFEEHERGALAPGMLADIVVLSDDPLEVRHDQLASIEVRGTMVGGQWVFASGIPAAVQLTV